VRIDLPAEGDTPRARPESHVADTPATAGHEPLDRVACAAKYRATVDAAYHGYQAVTSEIADRQTYEVQFRRAIDTEYGTARALAEAEYREERQSRDTNLPAPVQASADSEKKLLHADADPLRAFGPASETHPAELDAAMRWLDGAGVEVDMRHGAMSYSPSAAEGQPGRLILDPEASYGAVLHEMSHFSDDEEAGFPGLRYWLEDPAVTAAGESRAYQVEIDYANSISEAGIASELEELRAQRIRQLLGENDE
jgi:hypothetical protein